jgi:hypothetical protein
MVKQSLTIAFVKSILQVLDRVGPTEMCRRQRHPRQHGRRGRRHRRPVPRGTLDLDRLRRTGGNPGAGSSHQAPEQISNPRVRVTPQPPSPSPAPPAYWPIEPSDPTTSPWGHREPFCAIHDLGPCPYPVALRRSVLSSLSLREGEREGEERVVDVEGVVEVTAVEEEDDDESVEVILMPESPPRRPAYKQTARIRIGPWGRPTGTLASWTGARETDQISPKTGSEVWPLPPPPPLGGVVRTKPPPPHSTVAMTPPPPPPLQQENTTTPPLLSSVGGRILCRFAHLANPSCPGRRPGTWELSHWP